MPVALTRSACPAALASTRKIEPAAKATLPLTAIVPIELPGAKTPPGAIVTVPTVPVPPSVPPETTLTGEVMLPLTARMPPLMVVGPA